MPQSDGDPDIGHWGAFCASAGAAANVIAAKDVKRESRILRAILILHILALELPQRATRSYRWKKTTIKLNVYDTRMTTTSAFLTLWHGLIYVSPQNFGSSAKSLGR